MAAWKQLFSPRIVNASSGSRLFARKVVAHWQ
jgi:hypothetical protein